MCQSEKIQLCLCILSFIVILNPNDFDFLLSRGCNSDQKFARDSILERFDPIIGRRSIVPTPLIPKSEPVSIATPPSVNTILEVDTTIEPATIESNESSNLPEESPVVTLNVDECSDNEQITKPESTEELEPSNCGDGNISQASSETESYETASSDEQLEVINFLFDWAFRNYFDMC